MEIKKQIIKLNVKEELRKYMLSIIRLFKMNTEEVFRMEYEDLLYP